MAGQAPSRRELLQAIGLAAAASTFSGFSRWNYAFAERTMAHHDDAAPTKNMLHPVYQPQFFSPAEYLDIEVLADLILPPVHDGKRRHGMMQPGAREAGVAEFIDFMTFTDQKLQSPFRDGLGWLDRASTPSRSFAKMPAVQQTALLERLAYKAKHREGEQAGQQFFSLVRRYTVMGFYTTRIGLESLDYPGLVFYGTSPGCSHKDNPEHAGLPEVGGGQQA